MLNDVHRRADRFDVIHSHIDLLQYPLFQHLAHESVTALPAGSMSPISQPVYSVSRMPLISISDDQRRPMPAHVNWLATVYHGLPSSSCPYHAAGGDYLASGGSPRRAPRPGDENRERTESPSRSLRKSTRSTRSISRRRSGLSWTTRSSSTSAKSIAAEVRISRKRARALITHRLAGALRAGHDRGHVGRYPCHRLAPRFGS